MRPVFPISPLHGPGIRVAALVTLLLAACTTGATVVDTAAEEAAVRQRAMAWARAEASNNVDSSLSYLWDDAVMQPPGAPQIRGHEAIRGLYESVRFMSLDVVGPLEVTVGAGGDLAAVWANMTYELEIAGQDMRVSDSAKFVAVWQKRDGVWKVLENTWNSNQQPAAP